MTVTNTFSAGNTISASELNTNFSDATSALGGLTTSDLSASAGIVSTQLTDRYAIVTETISLTGSAYTAGVGTQAAYSLPAVDPGGVVWRKHFTLRTGRSYFLCGVTIYVRTISAVDAYPLVYVALNGNTIGGGAAVILTSDSTTHLRNSNPIDNPLISLASDDYLTIALSTGDNTGAFHSATTTTWNAASVTFTYKMELGA